MMGKFDITRINDGSNRPPRLEIHQSMWAMMELEAELSLEAKIERIAGAGFTGILARVPEIDTRDEWKRLLKQFSLSFGSHCFPFSAGDLSAHIQHAADMDMLYVNGQVADSFVIGEEAIDLLGGLAAVSAAHSMPFCVETHRGKITQDLIRTVQYAQALPNLRFTLDISHYVLAGEMTEKQEKAEPLLDRVLQRTSAIHSRISSGEQIQVDVGYSDAMLARYEQWWTQAMRYWLQGAKPGDVLPFVCELGPAPYAIRGQDSRELSSRWEQALILKNVAQDCWKRATVE
ncbi:sugar phosphate isomerase/epimerase family protein [Paenibacillus sp. Soil750]|uniref:sugar phosphate isomerase/epimerase family protein n=1 Tax=Paenibacillus sp. Soil750 TaxID=1736398 RepID=UPI000A4CC5AB|nr:sugar phosphate isomerase/epimerase [Paenibacillus sp. Soil750]